MLEVHGQCTIVSIVRERSERSTLQKRSLQEPELCPVTDRANYKDTEMRGIAPQGGCAKGDEAQEEEEEE